MLSQFDAAYGTSAQGSSRTECQSQSESEPTTSGTNGATVDEFWKNVFVGSPTTITDLEKKNVAASVLRAASGSCSMSTQLFLSPMPLQALSNRIRASSK